MTYGTGTVLMPIFRRTMVGACSLIAVYVSLELAVKPLWAYTTTKWSKMRKGESTAGPAAGAHGGH